MHRLVNEAFAILEAALPAEASRVNPTFSSTRMEAGFPAKTDASSLTNGRFDRTCPAQNSLAGDNADATGGLAVDFDREVNARRRLIRQRNPESASFFRMRRGK